MSNHTRTLMFAPSPLTRVRIVRRRILLTWRESDWLQPITVAGLITLSLFGSIVAVLWAVW